MERHTDSPVGSACDTCAFRPGPGAHEEPYNRLRSNICAMSGVPFFCHEGIDWRGQDAMSRLPGLLHSGDAHICAGWKERVSLAIPRGREHAGCRQLRKLLGGLALCVDCCQE